MRLIIAEKASLARAIAAALVGSSQKVGHHLECSNGDIVAWCSGHVLEVAPPGDYSADLEPWSLDTLPIVPDEWKHRVSNRELVDSIRKLLRKAACVVHAGDPDREGQLLVDELLEFLGWRGPTGRLLVTDLSPPAVRRALGAIEPNERFRPLYEAALARQRADWLYGLNLTRLYTLRARLGGYQGVLSVGRVQTPVLGLIVRRDRQIDRFVSKPFYGVAATLRTADGAEFQGHWAVGKEHEHLTDSEGRMLSRPVSEAVCRQTAGQPATVAAHEQQQQAEAAPLPYSLAELQMDAGRKLGLSAAQVLELAQRLYERQLITYPRSDCSYLPEEHFAQGRGVLAIIATELPRLAAACVVADLQRPGRAWSDAKITAHHAIIPTSARASAGGLGELERGLYELVAQRYVQQFLAPFEYLRTKVEIIAAGETFIARGRRILALGWKAFAIEEQEQSESERASDEEREDSVLPPLARGQRLLCSAARVIEKHTKPPKAFTDASLIEAMCNVGKYVSDPKARKILQDTDGIGTPATRAAIIETLFERRYIERKKKQIRATAVGCALIDALPEVATTPDMTAVWESAMRRINDRELELGRFLGVVTEQLRELVRRGQAQGALPLPSAVGSGDVRARKQPRRRSGTRPKASKAPSRTRAGVDT